MPVDEVVVVMLIIGLPVLALLLMFVKVWSDVRPLMRGRGMPEPLACPKCSARLFQSVSSVLDSDGEPAGACDQCGEIYELARQSSS